MRYMKTMPAGYGCPACAQGARVQQPCHTEATDCASLPVIVFVEPQVWDCTYSCGQALTRGTLFPALDKPFAGKGGCCNG